MKSEANGSCMLWEGCPKVILDVKDGKPVSGCVGQSWDYGQSVVDEYNDSVYLFHRLPCGSDDLYGMFPAGEIHASWLTRTIYEVVYEYSNGGAKVISIDEILSQTEYDLSCRIGSALELDCENEGDNRCQHFDTEDIHFELKWFPVDDHKRMKVVLRVWNDQGVALAKQESPAFAEYSEAMPNWLSEYRENGVFNIEDIFVGHSLYWTEAASVDSGAPIRLLNQAHAAHLFVYASCYFLHDWCKRDYAFRGYRVIGERKFDIEEVAPKWAGSYKPVIAGTNNSRETTLRIYERLPDYGEEHGARRFAFLELAGDTIELFARLYCVKAGRQAPLMVGVGDHSGKSPFGKEYKDNRVLKGGEWWCGSGWKTELEDIMRDSGQWPELMYAMGRDTMQWTPYFRPEGTEEIERQIDNCQGCLYRRIPEGDGTAGRCLLDDFAL